eukprot:m.427975 g.427975  ORF g.427975 m.427975 type:complete len:109 (-) comp21367_c0_seq3:105-431(-)
MHVWHRAFIDSWLCKIVAAVTSTPGAAPTPRGNHAATLVQPARSVDDAHDITVAIVGGSSTYSEESMRCLTFCNDVYTLTIRSEDGDKYRVRAKRKANDLLESDATKR